MVLVVDGVVVVRRCVCVADVVYDDACHHLVFGDCGATVTP